MPRRTTGAVIGTASAPGVIRNDDAAPPSPPASATEPTALEQHFLDLVLDLANPGAARSGRSGGEARLHARQLRCARQPLAWNDDLSEAAQALTGWMYANRALSRTGEGGSPV
ncbi:hypothetical protein GCM10010964_02610 [Caldovatus sediminis]|uniref:Uncharacterized protein n=1 Tax=Caldovatus sediminis TaxID=2041189 RepID=A0A8J3E9V1_9PROT|nr:hypothetical protein GCM10010964_02610 [Caldovatus sediminis]